MIASMLKVSYRYKQEIPDGGRRKQEAIDAKRNYPAKIPVRNWWLANYIIIFF